MKIEGFLSHDDDFPYEIIGLSESGSLLEVLSAKALLYSPSRVVI